jgi:hypothetical protein
MSITILSDYQVSYHYHISDGMLYFSRDIVEETGGCFAESRKTKSSIGIFAEVSDASQQDDSEGSFRA